MLIKKNNIYNVFIVFLFLHLLIWTLIPSISNNNLPLDVIEAIVWSDGWPLGWEKHPPLSSWFPGFFFKIFGNQDWSYYFLSQLFVVLSFFVVWQFSLDFFQNKLHSLISVLLLEGIYFYNFTTPEFNVNVCQLPFWSLSVYYCWKGIKKNDSVSWILFGLFAGLGILSKYLFIYLLLAIDIYFIHLIIKKKFNPKCFISLITFFLILTPHVIWLIDNNFVTINYALSRTDSGELDYIRYLYYPSTFFLKQIGILLPLFIIFFTLVPKLKRKINLKDNKLLFLLAINILPIILMFLTSLFMGVKIRTMWMTPFYLFIGVLLVYIFKEKIDLKKLKYSFSVFLFFFLFSPFLYLYISVTEINKRTDYSGEENAKIIQTKWNNNFSNKIESVIGDEWYAGNLSYHLQSKPKWYSYSAAFIDKSYEEFIDQIGKAGFIIVNGDCSYGISFIVDGSKICMSGNK